MPFEFTPTAPKKIAVIGAGISGLGSAYLLSDHHDVTLFEADHRLGGHARTINAGRNGDVAVDTGFIVFNYENYPNLTKMFDILDVPVKPSDMSFGVSLDQGRLEYSLNNLNTIFGQRRNILNPAFIKMLYDVVHFNKHGLNVADHPDMTLRELLAKLKTGRWHRDYYILPFAGAIWSTCPTDMLDFPAAALLQFFRNHGLLSHADHLQWYTVDGGSIQYVNRITAALRAKNANIRTNAPVIGIRRDPNGVWLRNFGSEWAFYDAVVMACHSDQALNMLTDPTAVERDALGAIKYQPNRAVLHADPIAMPKRKRVWSSWNYVQRQQANGDPVGVSYWMNRLQSLPDSDLLIQSLNPAENIRDALIYDETTFMHPVFDGPAMRAQAQIHAIQGQNNTWYAGAWLRHGFHEDGYASAVNVAQNMPIPRITACA